MSAVVARQPAISAQLAPKSLATLRPRIEDAIERLIAALDALDGDPDREGHSTVHLGDGHVVVLDPDLTSDSDVDAEPDEDGEPLLGWPNNVGMGAVTLSTGHRFQGSTEDGEPEGARAPRGGSGP